MVGVRAVSEMVSELVSEMISDANRWLVLALLLVPAGLHAQALPTAAEVVAKHTAAIGGRGALDVYTSMHEVGTTTVTIAGKLGPVNALEVFRRRPNLVLVKTTHGPAGARTQSLQGFDGTTPWIIASANSPPMIPERALADGIKKHANFLEALDELTVGRKLTTVTAADFEGRKCYKVKFASPEMQGFEFFDIETGLYIGLTMSPDPKTGRDGGVSVATDYKDFGGMKFATTTVFRSGRNVLTSTITSIEFDDTDATVFALPDAVKAIIKP